MSNETTPTRTIALAVPEQYRKRKDEVQVIQQANIGVMGIIEMAVRQGADVDKLEKLMALQERYEENESRKAFVSALAAFKSDPLIINKDKHVSYQSSKGEVAYDHATLGNICNIIGAALAKHGLSYRWATDQQTKITVTCTLMHTMGHQESVSLSASPDESGSKNSIQAIGSTVSYLQRYTLLAITGCATQEQDDDGRSSGFKSGETMPQETLDGYLFSIETATVQKDIASAYLKAIQSASEIGDQDAMNRINESKNKALKELKK